MQKELCDHVIGGASNKDAAALAGIDESTFYKWNQKRRGGDKGEICPVFPVYKGGKGGIQGAPSQADSRRGEEGSVDGLGMAASKDHAQRSTVAGKPLSIQGR